MNTGRKRGCSGSSLVEILVVATVLGIVIALLLPAISQAIETSRSTKCIGKLRQLGVNIRVWRTENNERLMPPLETASRRPSRYFFDGGVIQLAEEMQCPTSTTASRGAWLDGGNGSAKYRAQFDHHFISYGVNPYAFYQTSHYGMTTSFRVFQGRESKVPQVMDATAWQINLKAWSDPLSRIAPRHQKKANVLFLDGHVDSLGSDAILNLSPIGGPG